MYSFAFWLLHTGFFYLVLGCLSSCGARASRHVSAGPYAQGLSSCGSWPSSMQALVVVVLGLTCSSACGIFPRQGTKPLSPALAGGFSPTLPPEDDILSEDLKEEEVRKEARWLSERLRQRAACTRASFML